MQDPSLDPEARSIAARETALRARRTALESARRLRAANRLVEARRLEKSARRLTRILFLMSDERLYDYKLRRIFELRADRRFIDNSLYADVWFRVAEAENRAMISRALQAGGVTDSEVRPLPIRSGSRPS